MSIDTMFYGKKTTGKEAPKNVKAFQTSNMGFRKHPGKASTTESKETSWVEHINHHRVSFPPHIPVGLFLLQSVVPS